MISLKTLSEASAQEVFDQVKNHLLKQNEKCATSKDGCLYRKDNLSCAAGCLIADDEYKPSMESDKWLRLIHRGFVKTERHKDLIGALQEIHDECDVETWEEELRTLAESFNLEWN
jgi:hypothetical protein